MNITQIEQNIQTLVSTLNIETFIYEFLTAFGTPNATLKKLQIGSLNLSKKENEILWKKKIYFTHIDSESLHSFIDGIRKVENITKQQPRFIIVINDKSLVAYDSKTADTLDCELQDLNKYFSFFLPLAGMEKAQHQIENPADVKASEKMAKLYDEIRKDNHFDTDEEVHGLNVFLSRLLFCFFAEDTGIFDKSQFTHSINNHTQDDGTDLGAFLDRMFVVMNTNYSSRGNLPQFLNDFPYVNGGLFKVPHISPQFTRRSRQVILECGELNWSAINPDIFGSMIQAVITPEHRGGMGMHYTSVPNIMKVIEPLFLNDLYEAFDDSKGNIKKLNDILRRLWNIKIFDPACGSGNFLIISYKELRKLEMLIFQEIDRINEVYYSHQFTGITLNNFFGIELDDFAHEVAILSLWLAEHQMNVEFTKQFGRSQPSLPLKQTGNIIQGNACRIDWEVVCPKTENDEINILGNPPYLGGKGQSNEQKQDMEIVFKGYTNFKELDYIACWFILASKYINKLSKYSFVSTSSICEGAQVEQLWVIISKLNNEIFFAYKPFNWTNNAKDKAGVTCSIIGIQNKNNISKKFIFDKNHKYEVSKINGYLTASEEIYVTKRQNPFSSLPIMITGNSPYDGGNLMLTLEERNDLILNYPEVNKIIRKTYGANEFINNIERYCLWIDDEDIDFANSIPTIKERIENNRLQRVIGGDVARGLSNRPHQFRYRHTSVTSILIIPIVSSSRREYIPIGLLPADNIILSSAAAIYNTETYVFSVLHSRIHMLWVNLTSGKLRGDIRYLSALTYNTFPFPELSLIQKQELENNVYKILEEREKYSEKTLAQLYDPEKMPEGLREAHRQNDLAIERCYRLKPFESDEERLEYLFKLYVQMITKEKEQGTLFESTKKKKYNG